MAKVTTINYVNRNLTLLKIDEALEREQKKELPRNYLGASEIGHACRRKLFYSFRGCKKREIPSSGIKAIQDGFCQEDVAIKRIRMLPFIEFHTHEVGNPDKQIGFEFLNGHLCGHCDGIIRGILESPKTWHIWENKCVNIEKFNKLEKLITELGEKKALKEWDYVYYCQALLYMHGAGLDRHWLVVETPGGRAWTSCRTEFNQKDFEAIINKGKQIIFDNWIIPERGFKSRNFFECQWCDYQSICWDGDIPEVNCKSCRYRSAIENGKHECLCGDNPETVEISQEIIHVGCKYHVYNPALMPLVKLEEQQADGCLYSYGKIFFANCSKTGFPELKGKCDGIFTSEDLFNKIKNVNNISKEISIVIETFDGEVVEKDDKKAWEKQNPMFKTI